jgi:hypothetical protein
MLFGILLSFSYLSPLTCHCQSSFRSISIKKKKKSTVDWQCYISREGWEKDKRIHNNISPSRFIPRQFDLLGWWVLIFIFNRFLVITCWCLLSNIRYVLNNYAVWEKYVFIGLVMGKIKNRSIGNCWSKGIM